MRRRDSQRSKVYRAERVLDSFDNQRFECTKEIREFINKIVNETWFKVYFRPIETIDIRDGRGRLAAGGDRRKYGVFLTMPKWSRKTWVILHELAHGLQPVASAAHGPEFCAIFVYLVKQAMGAKAAGALCESFRKHRVDFRPYATQGPIEEHLFWMSDHI